MTKIWALCNVYNEADWLLHHIAHIYPYVDHILITEGNNSPSTGELPGGSTDGTLDLCHYLNKRLEKVRFCGKGFAHENNKKGQCQTFEDVMLKRAYEMGAKENDWIFLADPDEILPRGVLESLRATLIGLPDEIINVNTFGPMFWFNMDLFTWQKRQRLWRVRDDCHFIPTVNWGWKSNNKAVNKDNMRVFRIGSKESVSNFHYAFVKPPFRELTRRKWEVDCGYRNPVVLDWYKDVFMEWSYDDMGEAAYLRNKELTGQEGITFSGEHEKIKHWHGRHPWILRNHPMKKISDIRQIRESRVIIENERVWHHILKFNNRLFTTELTSLLKDLK